MFRHLAQQTHKYVALLLCSMCLLTPVVSFARPPVMVPNLPISGIPSGTATKFDIHFVNLMRAWRIPGATLVIVKHGKLITARGYGWSDIESRQPMQPNELFRIASVSKTITAATTLKLVEENKLSLDDKVFSILNDLRAPNTRAVNPALYQITVRDLLQMSSGWYTEGPGSLDPLFGPWSSRTIYQLGGKIPPDCIAATQLMMGRHLQFRPGTQYSYSNLNYCMLGLIINKVTGQPYSPISYENYVRTQILAPLGITDMRLGRSALYDRQPNEVKYYNYPGFSALLNIDSLPYSNNDLLQKNYADGGWIASAFDLAKFAQGLADYKILSPHMIQVMLARPAFQRNSSGYVAMAWTVKRIGDHVYWGKHGSFTGTLAQVIQRDDGTSYVALFNTQPGQKFQFLAQVQKLLLSYPVG